LRPGLALRALDIALDVSCRGLELGELIFETSCECAETGLDIILLA